MVGKGWRWTSPILSRLTDRNNSIHCNSLYAKTKCSSSGLIMLGCFNKHILDIMNLQKNINKHATKNTLNCVFTYQSLIFTAFFQSGWSQWQEHGVASHTVSSQEAQLSFVHRHFYNNVYKYAAKYGFNITSKYY